MARRKARRSGKIEPAVKTMAFHLTPGAAGALVHNTIDLSQCASMVNRRFYRQGLNWAVAGFTVFTQGTGEVIISKIPDTYIASNSWEKGMRNWLRMNNEALAESPSVKPKFLDFKVFMDNIHHSAGAAANLIPVDSLGNLFTLGEWEYSNMIIPRGTATPGSSSDREIIWTGANYPGAGASGLDAVSLIEGYAASRGLPEVLDPNAPADAADATGAAPQNWLAATFSQGTDQSEEVLEDMITENNLAPYPFENDGVHVDTQYPGGANNAPGLQLHDDALVTATTVGGKTSIPGTNFQGGLIRISNKATGAEWGQAPLVLVHLVPGSHRGYMCQPQKDV